jgi:uncharacterized protein YcbK (DUF882 family)
VTRLVILLGVVLAPDVANARRDHRLLWIRAVHGGAELRLHPFDRHGLVSRSAAFRLRRIFRSARTGQARSMNGRLIRVLVQIQRHFGGRRIDLVSGYRVPEEGHELESFHHLGRAADIRIPGVSTRDLHDYCRTLGNVGCGYYPNSTFVHVDTRARPGLWVDLGHRRYVRDPRDWLQRHP